MSQTAKCLEDKEIRLPKVLSIFSSSSYMICSIIGAGIFVSPKGVLMHTISPGMALATWLVTGLINLVLALCYAELALTFPKVGSDYTYMQEGLGDLPAFLYVCVSFVFRDGCSRAIIGLTFASYFCQVFFRRERSHNLICPPPDSLKRIVAALAISTLSALHCYSSKWSVNAANFLTAAKLTGLLVIIAAGSVHLALGGGGDNIRDLMQDSSTDPSSYALAFYSAFWAYSGVSTCINIVEELKEPLKKNVVISIVVSHIVVIAFYLLTNFAYVIVLSRQEILSSDAVALTFADKIFEGLFWLMPIFVSCSTFGSMSASIMASSRFVLAATRQRHLPRPLAMLTVNYLTPVPIFIVNLFICLTLLSTNKIYDLISYSTYVSVLGMTCSIISLIYLRIKKPNLERPFKLPLFLPISFLLVLIVLLFFPIYETPEKTGVCFAFVATGLPVYFLLVWPDRKRKPEFALKLEQLITHLMQKVTFSLPEDDDEIVDGERNLAFEMEEKVK